MDYRLAVGEPRLYLQESGRVLRIVQRWEDNTFSHIFGPSVLPVIEWRMSSSLHKNYKINLSLVCAISKQISQLAQVLYQPDTLQLLAAFRIWILEKLLQGLGSVGCIIFSGASPNCNRP